MSDATDSHHGSVMVYNKHVQELDMGKRLKVPISTARAKLFQLTNLVRTSGDDTVVVLEQRGGREQVALVREARLEYLEARVTELEKRDEQPFKLAGSLTSNLDDGALEKALREIRTEWTPRSTPGRARPKRTPDRVRRKATRRPAGTRRLRR